MRLATFNVLHGRAATGGPAAGDGLAAALAALDADVVALQELDCRQPRSGGVDQAEVAAAALGAGDWRYASAWPATAVAGRGWVHDRTGPRLTIHGPGAAQGPEDPHDAGGSRPSHGIALLTRLPVLRWRVRRLPAAPVSAPLLVAGRGIRLVPDQPRAVLAAVLEGPRGPFTAVAVHLSFVVGWNAGQLAAVRRWVRGMPRPWLLLGDLNMAGPLVAVAGPGWRRLARRPTYPAGRPRVQFDHVLAAGLTRAAVTAAGSPALPISDHRPLVVELTL